jgi:hypothetical protein
MEKALRTAGVPVKFVPVPGGEAVKWFDQYLLKPLN